jgi:hypothetical protein
VAIVDAVYEKAVDRGEDIVCPLTDEPWGVRRFFVRDPAGVVVNVLGHQSLGENVDRSRTGAGGGLTGVIAGPGKW